MKRLLRQDVTPRAAAPAPGPLPGASAAAPDAASPRRAARAGAPALAAAALVLAPLAAWGAWAWASRTPGFAVRRVVVTGNARASAESIAARSGAIGENALGLDLAAVRERVLGDPWIADATVRRSLPHELRVAIVERAPSGAEIVEGRRLALDGEGRALGEAGGEPLPEIRGLAAVASAERDAARELAAATLQAVQAASPELFARAESLDVEPGGKLVLRVKDAPPIWLSGPESADEAAAFGLREQGIGRAIDRAAWVDARWRDRLYVMTDAPARGAR